MPNACFLGIPVFDTSTATLAASNRGWCDLSPRSVAAATAPNRISLKSGWWDLNPRSPGPEPGAIPSFATARNDPDVPCGRGPYFAYFNVNRKDRAWLPALLHQSTPVKSAVLSQPTSESSHSSTITLGRPKRCRFPGRFGSMARNYFVARTKSVDNEPLHLESQHSFYHARTAAYSLRAYKRRVEYPSIPDRGGPPRSFLAPYDDSTSSGSSTGYPESANSD